MQLNHCTMIGRLTRDPEMRYAKNGTAICTLGLACNSYLGGKGEERKEETCFVDVVAFGGLAEYISSQVQKGSEVVVDGRLQYQTWEAKDGTKRSRHQIVAQTIQTPGGKAEGSGGPRQARQEARPPGYDQRPGPQIPGRPAVADGDDDLPF